MITMEDDNFYKIEDVCKLFKISRITAYRWVKSKKLNGYKVGKAFLFKKADIDKLIEDSRVNG